MSMSEWSDLAALPVVLGLLVWLLIRYIPQREATFLKEFTTQRTAFERHTCRQAENMAAQHESTLAAMRAISDALSEVRDEIRLTHAWDGQTERRRGRHGY